jgi:serine/threonine protein kinase
MINVNRLKWPDQISSDERVIIERYLSEQWGGLCTGHRFRIVDKRAEALPVSLTMIYGVDDTVKDILLMLNRTRGQALDKQARHPPKTCFSIVTGKTHVKIRVTTAFEGHIYLRLLEGPPIHGLPRVVGLRSREVAQDRFKPQVIMRRYDEDLYKYLHAHPELTIDQRLSLAYQACQALRNFQWTDFGPRYDPVFHGDVKPDNYLVKEGVAVLADFGWSCRYDCPGGTAKFMAPEIMKLLREVHTLPQLNAEEERRWDRYFERRLKAYGPQSDLWSLGLVLAEIFDPDFTPCEFLRAQETYNLERLTFYTTYSYREQGVVEQVFERQKQACRDSDAAQIWDLIQHMVRLDPRERWTADHIVSKIDRILFERSHRLFDEYLDAL